jgi:hypothetical protein
MGVVLNDASEKLDSKTAPGRRRAASPAYNGLRFNRRMIVIAVRPSSSSFVD